MPPPSSTTSHRSMRGCLTGSRGAKTKTKDKGQRTKDKGHRTQDTGHRTQDTGVAAALLVAAQLCDNRREDRDELRDLLLEPAGVRVGCLRVVRCDVEPVLRFPCFAQGAAAESRQVTARECRFCLRVVPADRRSCTRQLVDDMPGNTPRARQAVAIPQKSPRKRSAPRHEVSAWWPHALTATQVPGRVILCPLSFVLCPLSFVLRPSSFVLYFTPHRAYVSAARIRAASRSAASPRASCTRAARSSASASTCR
jgi:hypothetical protein